MTDAIKKISVMIGVSMVIAALLLAFLNRLPLNDAFNKWLYDRLAEEKYRFNKPPESINDIVLVLIDNDTLNKMPSRWPYPRGDFAKVLDNLENAGAKAVAFDFAFLGSSAPADDALLKSSLERNSNVILACSINERGFLDFRSLPAVRLTKEVPLGIVTKIQDDDGLTRKALTYLVSDDDPKNGFLSWEMQVLKTAESLSLDSFSSEKDMVVFSNDAGKTWAIPVNRRTGAFMINFLAHTSDFKRLSFYDVLRNDFDKAIVKNRIILVGLASSVLADIHNTPIGWLPGITLNANAFLTLRGQYFLNELPASLGYIVTILGVMLAAFLMVRFRGRFWYILVAIELALFLLLSYLFLLNGYIWNYSNFPLVVIICSVISRKMLDLTYRGLYV